MSSAPPPRLPKFYSHVVPLDAEKHGAWRIRSAQHAPWASAHNTIPLLASEFVAAQRSYPIVFSRGKEAAPLALMGLSDTNSFFDEAGKPMGEFYTPAYIRRYPFILAKLGGQTDDLSLCFDQSSELVGEFADGTPLFDGGEPSEKTKQLVKFCQDFDKAAARTKAFVSSLQNFDLLVEGHATVQRTSGNEKPSVYKGFMIIEKNRLSQLDGSLLREWCGNGAMSWIMAHLHSLDLIKVLAARSNDD